jgi:sporulation protein YlmC with PRC-barrel domain
MAYMLRSYTAGALAALLMLPLAAVAQETQERQVTQPRTEERREMRDMDVMRADRLIGQSVRDPQDQRIGRIDDLALNIREGRVAYAVIAHGGVFGMGADHRALPWNQLQPMPERGVVRVNMTQEQLERAQRIDRDAAWPATVDRPGDRPEPTTGERDRERIDRDRERERMERDRDRPATDRDHNVISMDRLIGMDVENRQGQRLGQINDAAVKRDGDVAYVVISRGGFLGIGGQLVAIPWDRLNVEPAQERVILDVTEEQFERARAFEPRDDRWPGEVDWPFTNGDRDRDRR